jgi:hypothetical protein
MVFDEIEQRNLGPLPSKLKCFSGVSQQPINQLGLQPALLLSKDAEPASSQIL